MAAQLICTFKKLTTETIEKGVRLTSLTLFWCFYCELKTYFIPFSTASIVDFEQVDVNWLDVF